MSHLANLISRFKPKKKYSSPSGAFNITVDGIMVGLPEDFVNEDGSVKVPIENFLQDISVLRSAWVSAGTDLKRVEEKNQGLINFLRRDRHVSPSETVVRLRISCPVPFAIPLFHLFCSVNEQSGRYGEISTEFFQPPPGLDESASELYAEAFTTSKRYYARALSLGCANEQARFFLCSGFYTAFYFLISLRELQDFLSQEANYRNIYTQSHSDEFCEIFGLFHDIMKDLFPWSYEAYERFPHTTDFKRLVQTVSKLPEPIISNSLWGKGGIDLLETYGNDELMLDAWERAYDDPRKALGLGGRIYRLTCPIHTYRQWVRHRSCHNSLQTIDFDHIVQSQLFYEPSQWTTQKGKIGAYVYAPAEENIQAELKDMLTRFTDEMSEIYQSLSFGSNSQLASLVLPYTYFVSALRNETYLGASNFDSLRRDSHAQSDIRIGAEVMALWWEHSHPGTFAKHMSELYYGDQGWPGVDQQT